ncbi:MAG: hypothetical protein KF784_15790 [Fimbriimonadaceae bacterium]|nr:hypothetical protein [Fimbriimonadaceae bacterium]
MQDAKKTQIPRRAFLQGATAAVGTTLLGLAPASSLASGLQKGGGPLSAQSSFSIGYWDGQMFTPAGELATGDATLDVVNLHLRGYGPNGTLKGIDANALVPMGKSVQKVPFTAWVAGPSGCEQVRFNMTVDGNHGLVLTARFLAGKLESVTDFSFIAGSGSGLKLREGVYVIANGSMNWGSYAYDASNMEAPLTGPAGPVASLQYVVLTVSRT